MDTTITAAPPQESAGATETNATETQTPVAGSGTETSPSQGQSDASSPQGTTEDTQATQSQRRQWTKNDEIRELRQQRREYRQEMQTLRSELDEMRQWRDQQANQPKTGKPERNPAEFWQDPEARLEALMEDKLARLEEGISGRFYKSREEHEQAQALRQEQQAGVEFIRSQEGYHSDDDEDLIQIIEDNDLATLGPARAANIAWTLLQQQRGVGNRTTLKQKASGVQGQPPGAGLGKKIWSAAEFDAALDSYDKDRTKRDPALEAELVSAQREGRVR